MSTTQQSVFTLACYPLDLFGQSLNNINQPIHQSIDQSIYQSLNLLSNNCFLNSFSPPAAGETAATASAATAAINHQTRRRYFKLPEHSLDWGPDQSAARTTGTAAAAGDSALRRSATYQSGFEGEPS